MALNPVLVIKVMDGNSVGVRARLKDDYVEHEIVLNSVLAYYWANDFPPVVKFLELFESGKMTQAHFSDQLRINLLAKYGGIWVDATLLIIQKQDETIFDSNMLHFGSIGSRDQL